METPISESTKKRKERVEDSAKMEIKGETEAEKKPSAKRSKTETPN